MHASLQTSQKCNATPPAIERVGIKIEPRLHQIVWCPAWKQFGPILTTRACMWTNMKICKQNSICNIFVAHNKLSCTTNLRGCKMHIANECIKKNGCHQWHSFKNAKLLSYSFNTLICLKLQQQHTSVIARD